MNGPKKSPETQYPKGQNRTGGNPQYGIAPQISVQMVGQKRLPTPYIVPLPLDIAIKDQTPLASERSPLAKGPCSRTG